jgi:hypothetical protein
MLQQKSFSPSLAIAIALATVATSSLSQVASAATFNFSFSNVSGPVSGAVQGTIILPDGDGTFAASAVTVTSAPTSLGYTIPLPLDFGSGLLKQNSFTVAGGQIDAALSNFFYLFFNKAFALNSTSPSVGGSFFDAASGGFLGDTGVQDSGNLTLTYTGTATTPEPTAVLGLLSIGVMGLFTKRKKVEK